MKIVERTRAEKRELAEKIAAIEGLAITDEQRQLFIDWEAAGLTPEQQRDEIWRRYAPKQHGNFE
jgi:hypothetical protein